MRPKPYHRYPDAAGRRVVDAERLLREARTAGRLSHSAVVTVHDVVAAGRSGGQEFVDAA